MTNDNTRFGPEPGEEPVDWALGMRLYLEAEGFSVKTAKAAEELLYGWAAGFNPRGHAEAFHLLQSRVRPFAG